jgi:hypothetical protein
MKTAFRDRRTTTHCCLLTLSFLVTAVASSGCDRVDQNKFDALYRAGKILEVNIDTTNGVQFEESRKVLTQFKTEISLLQGRTKGKSESAALGAYDDASEAYKAFLTIRELDLRGDTRDGRLLLGDGWIPVFAKFKIASEAATSQPTDEYKFIWVNTGDAITTLLGAAKKDMTEANRLVNGQS